MGVNMSLLVSVFIFFRYSEVELLNHMVALLLIFEETPYCFPLWLYQFTFPSIVHEDFLFSPYSPTLVISYPFDNSHSNKCEVITHFVLIFISLITNHVDHIFMYLLAIYVSSLEKSIQLLCPYFILFCFYFFNIYSFLRKRQSVSRVGTEREGDTAGSWLWAVRTEPNAGLELTNHEIMIWAEVRHLTAWATQAPLPIF